MECGPAERLDVDSEAEPPLRVIVPSEVGPFLKVTLPVGVPDVAATVAVNITDCP
jgi:hypothetical protein